MSVLKASGLEAFLRRPDPQVGLLLIYGDEADAVRELAGKAVKRIAGSLDDPFSVVKLDDADLTADPARLADEMQAISMLGGQKAIWVKGVSENFLKVAAPVLDGTAQGNFIVAESSSLAKSSKLRDALEKSPRAMVVPLYDAEDSDISATIEQALKRAGLGIEPDARLRLMELVGSARGLLLREVEKLALYAMGQQTVTLADVEAICGNGADDDTDDLADAVFTGELDAVDRIFTLLAQGGTDAGRMVMAVHAHAMKLQDLQLAINRGTRPEVAFKSTRPPVFFKRQPSFRRQLGAWDMQALIQAASTLGDAVFQGRLNAAMAEAMASRTLLSIARNARALMAGRS